MPGINNRFIGQNEQTAADMFYQFVKITTGKIGTADTPLKQDVT